MQAEYLPQELLGKEVGESHQGEEGQNNGGGDNDARDAVAPDTRRRQPLHEELGKQHSATVDPYSISV